MHRSSSGRKLYSGKRGRKKKKDCHKKGSKESPACFSVGDDDDTTMDSTKAYKHSLNSTITNGVSVLHVCWFQLGWLFSSQYLVGGCALNLC